MTTLTLVPLRPDGVRGTLEFVFSVHPSSSAAAPDASQPQKRGASITHEAVALVTKVLSSVPSSVTPETWFEGISGQLLSLFDGGAGPELAKTAAQIVGFGILGKKQFGAPGAATSRAPAAAFCYSRACLGAPGWNAFIQPLLQAVNPSLRPEGGQGGTGGLEPEIVDMRRSQALVGAQSLETCLRRLQTLILSSSSPGLCRRVLKPLLLQLWCLASWAGAEPTTEQPAQLAALSLIETYLRLFGGTDSILPLVENITYNGPTGASQPSWSFELDETGRIGITVRLGRAETTHQEFDLDIMEQKVASLVDILTRACSSEELSSLFLHLLRRWIESAQSQRDTNVHVKAQEHSDAQAIQELVEVRLLQRLMDKAPEKLVGHFDQLLDVISQVLQADGRSPLDDDLVAVVLSLVNLVITAPSFQRSDVKAEELRVIEDALGRIAGEDRADTSTTAHNLAMLLRYRDEVEALGEARSMTSARQVEDRKTYSLAMSYITGGSDNPPPVVSEGLNMMSSLIVSESTVLDIQAVLVLMSNLLKDKEDYINLRAIKVFTQLANKHAQSTMKELLDNYLDAQEKMSTDIRLRFGEALVQVVERLGQTFSGDVAQQTCEILLSIAGRRGYRPKALARQEKDDRLQKLKKAADGDGDTNMGDDDDEDLTGEDKANNDLMTQIVAGWESKRGSEDVRMRASSLSIFGAALETNIGGIGPTLVSSGVDVCIKVVTMERELEFGILRRAAVAAILSFVKALGSAREQRRWLGFGLTDGSRKDMQTALEYVAQTDNDGLVQQHARDVAESLENWQVGGLTLAAEAAAAGGGPGPTRLAGLRVRPECDGALADGSGRRRPRIEEVE